MNRQQTSQAITQTAFLAAPQAPAAVAEPGHPGQRTRNRPTISLSPADAPRAVGAPPCAPGKRGPERPRGRGAEWVSSPVSRPRLGFACPRAGSAPGGLPAGAGHDLRAAGRAASTTDGAPLRWPAARGGTSRPALRSLDPGTREPHPGAGPGTGPRYAGLRCRRLEAGLWEQPSVGRPSEAALGSRPSGPASGRRWPLCRRLPLGQALAGAALGSRFAQGTRGDRVAVGVRDARVPPVRRTRVSPTSPIGPVLPHDKRDGLLRPARPAEPAMARPGTPDRQLP